MDTSYVKFSEARRVLHESPMVLRTPLVRNCSAIFPDVLSKTVNLCLKLEHMQNAGSFKIRGVVNQFHHAPSSIRNGEQKIVTMSAGNYGRAFAEACHSMKLNGLVVMPDHAPQNRVEIIKSKGVMVEMVPNTELVSTVKRYQDQGMVFMHSFDDIHLIHGYGSISMEIFEDEPKIEVIVVCCGGGGLLAGVAAAAKLINPDCKVYGVEPITANCMHRSFQAKEAVSFPESKSIASGLSPPFAGKITYEICKEHVEDILLVSDQEIMSAVSVLYNKGLLVEPAGSAAFAALMFNKIPDIDGKNVCVMLTGRNVTPEELVGIFDCVKDNSK